MFEYELKTQVDPTEKKQRLVKQTSRTHQKDLELMVNYIVMFIFIVIYCIFTQSAAVLASCDPIVHRRVQPFKDPAAMAESYGTALENSVKRVVAQIRSIIDVCGRKATGVMQPSVDQIVQMCLGDGVAEKRNIMPRHTGIHPENRGKTGVDPFNAQKLTLNITIQGYSETKLENPMGFQKAAPGPLHDEQQAFNEKNFAEGNGYIKPIEFTEIEFLPVTCSHTFATVNIVEGGGPGFHEELCNEQGYIDKNKVLELCPSWLKPMTDGIPCIVFKRELDVACLALAPFLSKATNATGCRPIDHRP